MRLRINRKASLTPSMQAGLYYARRNNRSRALFQTLTPWSAGLVVTSGELVTNANNLYTALGSGTTGATPPIQDRGNQSDGTITWQYTDPQILNTMVQQ